MPQPRPYQRPCWLSDHLWLGSDHTNHLNNCNYIRWSHIMQHVEKLEPSWSLSRKLNKDRREPKSLMFESNPPKQKLSKRNASLSNKQTAICEASWRLQLDIPNVQVSVWLRSYEKWIWTVWGTTVNGIQTFMLVEMLKGHINNIHCSKVVSQRGLWLPHCPSHVVTVAHVTTGVAAIERSMQSCIAEKAWALLMSSVSTTCDIKENRVLPICPQVPETWSALFGLLEDVSAPKKLGGAKRARPRTGSWSGKDVSEPRDLLAVHVQRIAQSCNWQQAFWSCCFTDEDGIWVSQTPLIGLKTRHREYLIPTGIVIFPGKVSECGHTFNMIKGVYQIARMTPLAA